MTKLSIPLMGAHFRPPAKFVLANIPSGLPLSLLAEPENPYDPLAIKVLLNGADIPASRHEALGAAIDGTGHDLPDLLANPEIFLGYIARTIPGKVPVGNVQLLEAMNGAPLSDASCQLAFSGDGKPLVEIETPEPIAIDDEQNVDEVTDEEEDEYGE